MPSETKPEVKHSATPVRIKSTIPKGVKLVHDMIAIGVDGENLCYTFSRSKAERIVLAVNAFDQMRVALEAIVRDLPAKRDWLDPVVERMARAAIRSAGGKE